MTYVTVTPQLAVAMGCLVILVIAIMFGIVFCVWSAVFTIGGQDEDSGTESSRSSRVTLPPSPIYSDLDSDSGVWTDLITQIRRSEPAEVRNSREMERLRLSTSSESVSIPDSVSEVQEWRDAEWGPAEAVAAEIRAESSSASSMVQVGQPTGPQWIELSNFGGRQRQSAIPESVSVAQETGDADGEQEWETIIGETHEERRLSRDFTGVGFGINLPGERLLAE